MVAINHKIEKNMWDAKLRVGMIPHFDPYGSLQGLLRVYSIRTIPLEIWRRSFNERDF